MAACWGWIRQEAGTATGWVAGKDYRQSSGWASFEAFDRQAEELPMGKLDREPERTATGFAATRTWIEPDRIEAEGSPHRPVGAAYGASLAEDCLQRRPG